MMNKQLLFNKIKKMRDEAKIDFDAIGPEDDDNYAGYAQGAFEALDQLYNDLINNKV